MYEVQTAKETRNVFVGGWICFFGGEVAGNDYRLRQELATPSFILYTRRETIKQSQQGPELPPPVVEVIDDYGVVRVIVFPPLRVSFPVRVGPRNAAGHVASGAAIPAP